ncbi:macrosialin [Pseudonaja textilis]|uniref:macrosialin n=1 Tax=Pseudonaja textilis TaxID=8673 RepID=UPI000EA87504|nr:macrosialin [Pseudonaja textilis]
MRMSRLSVATVLWMAGWCLLVAAGRASEPGDPENCPSGNCPRPTKSATLVPSFTETPKRPTTPPQKHTTTHHHRRHTTANRTTTTHHPHHTTTTTTAAPTTTTTTTAPQNHTTGHHTLAPANHTSSAVQPTTIAPPQPTQPPAVPVGNYTVRQGATVCLRAEMGLQLRIQYGDKAKRQVWGAFAVQPKHTNVSGTCSNKTATLKLQFPEGFILFTFQKNETEKLAYLSQVQANLTYQFPQATEATTFRANNASLREFAAPLGKCYQCRNRSLGLSETFRLTALSERIQAFQLQDGKFGEAELCPEQQKRSIVFPIVVGVVLGLLILIVLVAFAVGRWRGRTGYESL